MNWFIAFFFILSSAIDFIFDIFLKHIDGLHFSYFSGKQSLILIETFIFYTFSLFSALIKTLVFLEWLLVKGAYSFILDFDNILSYL